MAPRKKRAASPTTRADASTALVSGSKRARRSSDERRDDDGTAVAARDGAISLRAPARRGTRDGGRTSTLAMPIMTLSNAHRGASANAIAFSRDGRGLASGGSDKTTALWRTSDGASGNTNYATLVGCKNAVTGCVYTMDDECVVTSDADGIVRVWDAETGTQAKSYASTRGKCANDVSAARGDVIASVGDDGNACVWDLRVKKKAVRKMAIGVPQTCVELSADGERAYTAGVDEVVRAWDARMDGEAILTLPGHEDTVTGLALSPCGSYLLSNAMDNTLRMWDTRAFVEGEREVKRFVGHSHNYEKALLRCAFNSDGSYVSAGSADSCVYVWDTASGKLKYKLPGHKGVVTDTKFSPTENAILASADASGLIFMGELDH